MVNLGGYKTLSINYKPLKFGLSKFFCIWGLEISRFVKLTSIALISNDGVNVTVNHSLSVVCTALIPVRATAAAVFVYLVCPVSALCGQRSDLFTTSRTSFDDKTTDFRSRINRIFECWRTVTYTAVC